MKNISKIFTSVIPVYKENLLYWFEQIPSNLVTYNNGKQIELPNLKCKDIYSYLLYSTFKRDPPSKNNISLFLRIVSFPIKASFKEFLFRLLHGKLNLWSKICKQCNKEPNIVHLSSQCAYTTFILKFFHLDNLIFFNNINRKVNLETLLKSVIMFELYKSQFVERDLTETIRVIKETYFELSSYMPNKI